MNPLAKLIAALVVAAALLMTLNPWVALSFIVLELLVLPMLGVSVPALLRVILVLGIAAACAALTNALYGATAGADIFVWGVVHISTGSLAMALSVALRIIAIGLPGAALMSTVDPTDLADALAQLWRLPARFVYGSLAAVRLLSLLSDDWRDLGLARRARGFGSGHGPIAALTRFSSQTFALFVMSLRRGNTLAIAMDARGLGASVTRTWARTSRWRARDTLFVAATVIISLAFVVFPVVVSNG